jgi:hypothetical protein
LIDQITVDGVHLHAVEPSLKSVSRRLGVFFDNSGDLGRFQRARRRDRLETLSREGLSLRPDGGRRNRQRSARLEGRMGDAPDVPKLKHDMAAGDMNCFGHTFPALDLLSAVNSRSRDVALTLWRDLGRFGNNEPGAGALGVIEGVQLRRHVAGTGTAARKRRHDKAIGKP